MTGRSAPLLCLARTYAAVATSPVSTPAVCSARVAFRRPIQQYHCGRRYNLALSSSTGSYPILTPISRRSFSTPKGDGNKGLQREQSQPGASDTGAITQSVNVASQKASIIGDKVRSLTPREQIYNIPNILTASRLIAAPFVGYLVLHEQHKWALALFAYAGITDLVDGWIARKYKLQTVVGSVIDPMADKFLMTILTVTLSMNGLLPVSLATLILGRDVSLAVAALYWRYASLPAPKTFKRYWDFSLPSAEVHPTTMSKYNTFLQLLLIGATLAYPVITADNHHMGIMHDIGLEKLDLAQFMTYFQIVVAATTAWSGLSYAFLKDAVKILGKDEQLKLKQGRRGRAIIGVTFGSVVAAAAYLALTKDLPKKKEEGVVA
ncbi:MAG: 2-isopropylmalate synthase [Aureobasidium pullulans]|nr:MAG: 2-isopropylmalate synthase [Aureobasidium pullulans]TIA78169.1 hypothetical protein D6C76_04215 [Aureobasidium pullulans]